MEKCKEYLRKAKAQGWAIDMNDLMHTYNLKISQVKKMNKRNIQIEYLLCITK